MASNLLLDHANWNNGLVGTWDATNNWFHVATFIPGSQNFSTYVGTVNAGDYVEFDFHNAMPGVSSMTDVNFIGTSVSGGVAPCCATDQHVHVGPFTAGDTINFYTGFGCCNYNADFYLTPSSAPPPPATFWTDFVGCKESLT